MFSCWNNILRFLGYVLIFPKEQNRESPIGVSFLGTTYFSGLVIVSLLFMFCLTIHLHLTFP